MNRFNLGIWLGFTILTLSYGVCFYGYWQLAQIQAALSPSPQPTEQIFTSQVLDRRLGVDQVTRIEAIENDLITAAWSQPSDVLSPVCYSIATCILYDEQYLLVDPENNVAYFYQTAICEVCPNGEVGQVLGEAPRCQIHRP